MIDIFIHHRGYSHTSVVQPFALHLAWVNSILAFSCHSVWHCCWHYCWRCCWRCSRFGCSGLLGCHCRQPRRHQCPQVLMCRRRHHYRSPQSSEQRLRNLRPHRRHRLYFAIVSNRVQDQSRTRSLEDLPSPLSLSRIAAAALAAASIPYSNISIILIVVGRTQLQNTYILTIVGFVIDAFRGLLLRGRCSNRECCQ